MTSIRKQFSNRRNALKSTGPKTTSGKTRSAMNSVVHGLSSTPIFEGEDLASVLSLTAAFLGGGSWDVDTSTLARHAAEQQIMVGRVKETRRKVWEKAKTRHEILRRGKWYGADEPSEISKMEPNLRAAVYDLKRLAPHIFEPPIENEIERDVIALELIAKELNKIVRYERRVINARDKLLRELDLVKSKILIKSSDDEKETIIWK